MEPEPGSVYTAGTATLISYLSTLDTLVKSLIGVLMVIYICLGIRNRWKNKPNKENENE